MQNNAITWKCALISIIKYKGISSAKVVDEVKPIIFDRLGGNREWLKFGHGGTLDESATGVLVIGTGLGCKLMSSFLRGSKCYRVSALLGIETDTLNESGKVVRESPFNHITYKDLKLKTRMFTGMLAQVPPKYSALKLGGKRFSDLTREGIDVPTYPRQVQCHSIEILRFNPPHLELQVECGGGFYIRSLVRDLAQALNTCAHVTDLHRTKHGFLTEKDSLSRDDWTYENLLRNAESIKRKTEFKRMFAKYFKRQNKLVRPSESQIWLDPS